MYRQSRGMRGLNNYLIIQVFPHLTCFLFSWPKQFLSGGQSQDMLSESFFMARSITVTQSQLPKSHRQRGARSPPWKTDTDALSAPYWHRLLLHAPTDEYCYMLQQIDCHISIITAQAIIDWQMRTLAPQETICCNTRAALRVPYLKNDEGRGFTK